jgi:hypothetical protein
MIEWYSADINGGPELCPFTGQPLQKFHPAGRSKSESKKIQTTHYPKCAITGQLLEVYL